MSHNAVLLCWFPGSQIYWVEAELCISNSRHFWQAKCACVCTGMCVRLCVCYFGKQTLFFPKTVMHLVFAYLYNKAQDRYRWELKFISNSKMFISAHLSFFPCNKRHHISVRHTLLAKLQLAWHPGGSGYFWSLSMCTRQGQCLIGRRLCWYLTALPGASSCHSAFFVLSELSISTVAATDLTPTIN